MLATVNGGIWETTNATAADAPLGAVTDSLPSLSMGALAFDPTDATHQTLNRRIGATSSFGAIHNPLSGVLLTTNGGQRGRSWERPLWPATTSPALPLAARHCWRLRIAFGAQQCGWVISQHEYRSHLDEYL